MKKILGLLLVSALLWSCGSQFSRSKYDRFMWNRSHGESKTETAVEIEKTTDTKSEVKNEVAVVVNNDNNEIKSNDQSVQNIPALAQENSTDKTINSDNSNASQSNTFPENKNKKNRIQKVLGKSIGHKYLAKHKAMKGGNSDLSNILYIVLIVILIILVLTLLQTILGPTLSWILGVILLVVLIYFLLKLLGVI